MAAAGCGSTGSQEVRYPAFASGTGVAGVRTYDDFDVTLDVAQVGLGPIYFCATSAASSSLCPTAMAELAAVAAVDALSPDPQAIGTIEGVTGAIRSATYDFGVTWLATESGPTPHGDAPGGHSAHFEGRAVRGASQLRFVADVDVVPQFQGTRAVNGTPVSAEVMSSNVRLDIQLDPAAWWAGVGIEELLQKGGDPVQVVPGMRAYNALFIGMSTGKPVFEWRSP